MRILKNILSQLHRWVLWFLLSVIFWGWIFTLLTDTVPARKVTLYAQVEACQDEALELRLEEDMPQGLKMVKAHAFSHAIFDTSDLQNADLFILRASEMEKYLPYLVPMDDSVWNCGDREKYRSEGQIYGVKIYDAALGTGAAMGFLTYDPAEDCYLCVNAASPHLEDGAALCIAETLLNLN